MMHRLMDEEGTAITVRKKSMWLAALFMVIAIIIIAAVVARGELAKPTLEEMDAVAVINGQYITSEQYMEELRLSETKKVIGGKNEEAVDEPALFNRMIGDVLLLQGAAERDVSVSEELVQREIATILRRVNHSPEEMRQLLADHKLEWSVFERSVRNYLTLSAYIDEVILEDIQTANRQDMLQTWMREQYEQADMQFNQRFLDSINSPVPTLS